MARTPLKSPLAVLCVFCFIHGAVAVDFVVVNTNATGPGSLAQAITDANNLAGADRIVFNIPGAGVQKIDVSNNYLPKITDPLTIDGYTQPGSAPNTLERGSNAVVLIQIDGAYYNTLYYAGPPVGIWIDAPDCTVRGLMITRFSPFTVGVHCCAYSGAYGIRATDRSIIEGNFIGTDGSARTDLGNKGVGIFVGGADYRIGGTSPAARNMIGGNVQGPGGPAIGILVSSSNRGKIIGNHIGRYTPTTGSSGAGTEGAPNDIGIALNGTFTDTVIGGVEAGSSNVISGNGAGISTAYIVYGSGSSTTVASGVIVQGNLIGAARNTATPATGNGIGIELYGSSAGNTIGGTAPGQGNLIGSNATGIQAFSSDTNYPAGSIVAGNDIEGNTGVGVLLQAPHHLIGGLETGAGNRINHNGTGVVVRFGVTGNPILSNLIEANTGLGIDLDFDGPTSNDLGDADTGSNKRQNFPTITTVNVSGGNTTITASLNSTPSSNFTVQFFGNLQGEANQRLLDSRTVATDASGFATFQVVYPGVLNRDTLTATATDGDGNTSELLPLNGPVQFANLSTRALVGTGDNIMIGGFIIRSNSTKKVIVRALGPSLNVPGRLADPYLEIYDSSGTLLAKNDDWKTGQQQEVMNSGVPPSSDVESAVVITLNPGNYTAQVRGVNGGTGLGVVEVYDLSSFPADTGRLANISTRAFIGANDNVLIGGFIARGDNAAQVIVRAIGPDLTGLGVPGALPDPILELRDRNGSLLASNDNWRDSNEQQIKDTQLAPNDDRDSAIVASLAPGNYTAIVRGKDGATGLGLIEFYDLKQ